MKRRLFWQICELCTRFIVFFKYLLLIMDLDDVTSDVERGDQNLEKGDVSDESGSSSNEDSDTSVQER